MEGRDQMPLPWDCMQRRGEALTGMDPDTALLAGHQEAGAILLQVRGGQVDVRAAASRGEAHFWNQWLGPLRLGGQIWSAATALTKTSKLHLRRGQAHTSGTRPVSCTPHLLCQQKAALFLTGPATAPRCTAIIPELLIEVTSNDSNSISHSSIKQRPPGTTGKRKRGKRQLGLQSFPTRR